MVIWFDMDGTIADLYGQKNWLHDIQNENTAPYKNAKPLGNMAVIAKLLHKAQRNGHKIGIVSWTGKNSTLNYAAQVAKAKNKWLKTHLKSVQFDYIHIIPYGTPKQKGREGILFDDEELNRKMWGANAYEPQDIVKVLKAL